MYSTNIPEYAGVIIVNTQGELVLQLRDNKPNIADPNKLSIFAGRLLPNESKEEGALRELFEETTIRLDKAESLKFLFSFHAQQPRYDIERICHVFLLQNVSEETIDVREGQGYKKIKDKLDMETYDIAQISKDILFKYFDQST